MIERLDYYIDRLSDIAMRTRRWCRWHAGFYLLPVYEHPLVVKLMPTRAERVRQHLQSASRYDYARFALKPYVLGAATAIVLVAIVGITIGNPEGVPAHSQDARAVDMPAVVAPDRVNQPPQPGAPMDDTQAQLASEPFIFGLGAQLGGAVNERLYKDAPVGMLTSWFNRPSDLEFMRPWAKDVVPQSYAAGKSLHLIVWASDEERQIQTKYGQACGRAYPFSPGFEQDMRQLAETFRGQAGSPTLYVSMFTEFQTYPCKDNAWAGNENYYRALQDQYRLAQSIFKQTAPNSQVSLTWGGWQSEWDDPAQGSGRSLLPHFADVMQKSDFQSFQAMDSTGKNMQHISDMTRLLHKYGNGKVMIAHYKPDNRDQSIWTNDLSRIFTPATYGALRANGLFAFSFMDEYNANASEESYVFARDIIRAYARP